LIDDMRLSGELPALMLTALCNFVLQRFADLRPAWDKAPDDLDERIAYVPLSRDTAEQVEEGQRYQFVADTLELSARADWPELDHTVRLICQLTHGDPEDDSLMAEKLLEVCECLRRRG
jgi:hypothetical protein